MWVALLLALLPTRVGDKSDSLFINSRSRRSNKVNQCSNQRLTSVVYVMMRSCKYEMNRDVFVGAIAYLTSIWGPHALGMCCVSPPTLAWLHQEENKDPLLPLRCCLSSNSLAHAARYHYYHHPMSSLSPSPSLHPWITINPSSLWYFTPLRQCTFSCGSQPTSNTMM